MFDFSWLSSSHCDMAIVKKKEGNFAQTFSGVDMFTFFEGELEDSKKCIGAIFVCEFVGQFLFDSFYACFLQL